MDTILVVFIFVIVISLLLISGVSSKSLRFIGGLIRKLAIGGMMIFLLNAAGGEIGLHVPINGYTVGIVGILGVPGLCSLAAIQYWVI